MSKLDDYEFKGVSQSVVDMKDDMRDLLNNGKYQASVATTGVPGWVANVGEFAFYSSGSDQRLYLKATSSNSSAGWKAVVGPNTVTQDRQALGVTLDPSTTSTTFVDLTDMSLTFTPEIPVVVLAMFSSAFSTNSANVDVAIRLVTDGAEEANSVRLGSHATINENFVLAVQKLISLTAASHTIKVQWNTASGTASAENDRRILSILELKR